MLNLISIKSRMLFYIALTIVVFIIISYFARLALSQNENTSKLNIDNFQVVSSSLNVNYIINKQYTQLRLDLNSGNITWEQAELASREGIQIVKDTFATFNASLSDRDKQSQKGQDLLASQESLITSFEEINKFFNEYDGIKDTIALNNFSNTSMLSSTDDVVSRLNAITDEKISDINEVNESSLSGSKSAVQKIQYTLGLGGLVIVAFGLLLLLSIIKPVNKITAVLKKLSDGEFDTRVKTIGSDEMASLGVAVNGLLDDRATTLSKIDSEHQELNFSIFSLLQSVAELSERDLTIRADVSEDATGPVADALNLLAEETSSTLKKVRNVAFDVSETSQKVNTHIKSVNKLAVNEHKGALETAEQMNLMLQRLDSISKSASATSDMANTASVSTKQAHESVTETLSDMSNIRVTVQETGKRIKQLGERSEEISNVIDIINTIAERTTVLALNASMQAVKAGDAGKGFAVIAEEIQRLSETSRESTSEISTLVNNIQQETNTTIATMDKTIKQVIDGSTKAGEAVTQMQSVLSSTNELVGAVDKIATASLDQVSISQNLKVKAEGILESTQTTGQELLSLTGLSRNMSEYAQQLVVSVNAFTLEKKADSI